MSKKSKLKDSKRCKEHKEIKYTFLNKDAVTENYIYSVYQTLCLSATEITFIGFASKNQDYHK